MPTSSHAPRGARRSDARLKKNVEPIGAAHRKTSSAVAASGRGARRSDERLKTNVRPVDTSGSR